MGMVRRFLWLIGFVVVVMACSDEDSGGTNTGQDVVDQDSGTGGSDTIPSDSDGTPDQDIVSSDDGGGEPDTTKMSPILEDGLWFAAVSVEPLGGFVLPLQLDIASMPSRDGGGMLTSISIRAVGADGVSTSDVLGTTADVAVAADGTFKTALLNVTLPGQYTITGSDVVVEFQFDGTIQKSTFMCGKVTGTVVTLNLDLGDKTTFAATTWGQQTTPPAIACDSGNTEDLPHIAVCPDFVPGMNTGFNTANLDRSFRVFLPNNYDAAQKWPLVFLFHGLGSSTTEMLDVTEIDDFVDQHGFILILPESTQAAVEWHQLNNSEQNPDLIFFDDLVACGIEKLNVDPDRVHVTGMSAGGLFTVFLSVMRSSVIASSAPFSGGLIIEPPPDQTKIPMLVTWGGPTDAAVGQNFDTLATELIQYLRENDHFVAQCNHGTGHEWPKEMTSVAVDFLLNHPKGISPEPYALGLPDSTPLYCTIAE